MANREIRSRLVGINIPYWERVASLLVGGGLVSVAVPARWLGARVLAYSLGAGAVGFVARGITGRSALYRMRAVRKGIEVRRAVTIQARPAEIYALWRDLRNLPRFMQHVKSIEIEDERLSRWVLQEGPKQLSWRAEITEDSPDRRLRWRTLPGAAIDHEGIVDLYEATGGRGTVVEVRIRYKPPGGLFVMGMFDEQLRKLPGLQLAEELARLRMLVETGELATGARNPGETREKVFTAARVR